MPKKIKEKPPIYDERCGDCFYNEKGACRRNPEKCPYNQPPKTNEEEEEEECQK